MGWQRMLRPADAGRSDRRLIAADGTEPIYLRFAKICILPRKDGMDLPSPLANWQSPFKTKDTAAEAIRPPLLRPSLKAEFGRSGMFIHRLTTAATRRFAVFGLTASAEPPLWPTLHFMRHTISILVENKTGALARISGMFSGRGFNIDTLNVGPTLDASASRMTIVVRGDDKVLEQVTKQLNKLVDVIDVQDFRDALEVLGLILVGHLEQQRLGALDELRGLPLVIVHGLLDLLRGREQPAEERVLLDDVRVVARVSRHGDGGGQL